MYMKQSFDLTQCDVCVAEKLEMDHTGFFTAMHFLPHTSCTNLYMMYVVQHVQSEGGGTL